ncbi:hypothetical protein Stsp01_13150 [Streptomyces sp. NBRC 13847]|nr:hypothetical protein Stsp01_13150 [Streptomyces sp. NBRC 13847]
MLPPDTTNAAAANAVMRVRLILHTLQKIARFRSGRSLERGPADEKPSAGHIRSGRDRRPLRKHGARGAAP